jgi:hypothetical protein
LSHKDPWERRFQELVKFKQKSGHCNVPIRWSENRQLGQWVENQRKFYSDGKLSKDRFQRLRNIGFRFKPREEGWDEMYASLVGFKKTKGHCIVPEKRIANTKLARWVKEQRVKWKNGTLSEEQFQKLDNLGFVWQRHEAAWEEMYSRLVRFKNKWGHCKVPYNWSADRQLSRWVYRQRSYRNKGLLNKERIKLLNKIGFVWKKNIT